MNILKLITLAAAIYMSLAVTYATVHRNPDYMTFRCVTASLLWATYITLL